MHCCRKLTSFLSFVADTVLFSSEPELSKYYLILLPAVIIKDENKAVQIEREMFERVAVAFFRPNQLRRSRAMADWKVTEQAPEQFAPFLLVGAEFPFRFNWLRGANWGTA